jgi:hypothetical protein
VENWIFLVNRKSLLLEQGCFYALDYLTNCASIATENINVSGILALPSYKLNKNNSLSGNQNEGYCRTPDIS